MADCKVLGDFLHILEVEQRIETCFILGRERKYEIIMLKEIRSLQLQKVFINLSCRLMKKLKQSGQLRFSILFFLPTRSIYWVHLIPQKIIRYAKLKY